MDIYRFIQAGPFISCPGDAKSEAKTIKALFDQLPITGSAKRAHYWPDEINIFEVDAAIPTQYQIAQTSSAGIDPVIVLLAERVGTPAPPPRDGWDTIRSFLNERGWEPYFAFLGIEGFDDIRNPPRNKIPVTGTVYEVLDALRTKLETQIWLIALDTDRLRSQNVLAPVQLDDVKVQWNWRRMLVDVLKLHHSVIEVQPGEDFEELIEQLLRQKFLSGLDPLTGELPGFTAISAQRRSALFGRSFDLAKFNTLLFGKDDPSFMLVTGVKGVGKTSFFRAGLQGDWCKPGGIANNGEVVLSAGEPYELAALGEGDPLKGLIEALKRGPKGGRFAPIDEGPHAFPEPAIDPGADDLPELTDNLGQDLYRLFEWWDAAMAQESDRPIVLLIDQAEQVETIANQRAMERATLLGLTARSGEGDEGQPVKLEPEWARFTGFIALLAGRADLGGKNDLTELSKRASVSLKRRPVKIVMSVHRQSTFDVWPMLPVSNLPQAQVYRLEPITQAHQWSDVIDGTVGAYGLRLDPVLVDRLSKEAEDLVTRPAASAPQLDSGVSTDVTLDQVSVMPQVMATLLSILSEWRRRYQEKPHDEFSDRDQFLSIEDYGHLAGITDVIDLVCEAALSHWNDEMQNEWGVEHLGPLSARKLFQVQAQAIHLVLGALSQYDPRGRQMELTWCHYSAPRLLTNPCRSLLNTLHQFKIVTSVGGNFIRFTHSSIIEHWHRAKDWSERQRMRLVLHSELASRHEEALRRGLVEPSGFDVTEYRALYYAWPGSGAGEDGNLLAWLKDRLAANFAPSVDLLANEEDGYNLLLLATARHDWAMMTLLWRRINDSLREVGEDGARSILVYISGLFNVSEEVTLKYFDISKITDMYSEACVQKDAMHGSPLLYAAQNGHRQIVQALLDAGADPNELDAVRDSSPLLQAAFMGEADIVGDLLSAGANPSLTTPSGGVDALHIAAARGNGRYRQ